MSRNLDYRNPDTLKNLYWSENLSSRKIAKKLKVSNSPILYWMRKFDISRRPPKRIVPEKYKIPENILKDLYVNKSLSIKQIAKKFSVDYETIRLKLIKYKIPLRPSGPQEKYKITKVELENLYLKKRLSIRKIAKDLAVSDRKIIWSRLSKYNIPRRTISEATTKYPKTPFSGDLKEKSYMIGLRTGDISSYKSYKLIRVTCCTTKPNQLKMFIDTFTNYGHIHYFTYKSKTFDKIGWSIYCYLDSSFDFLVEKIQSIPDWILNDDEVFYSFLAGYADAEGCWSIAKYGKDAIMLTFCIATCDKTILEQIKKKLLKLNYKTYLRLRRKKGDKTNIGIHNKDYYGLVVSRKQDVVSLSKKLLSLSRHKDKIHKMNLILENRDNKWSEFKNIIKQ